MDVYVHSGKRHLQIQHAGGKPARQHLIAVGLLQGGGEQFGLDVSPVDVEKLAAAVATGGSGQRNKTLHGKFFAAAVYRDHLFGRLPPEDGIDSGEKPAVPGGGELLLPVPEETEGDLRMGHGKPVYDGGDESAFCHVRFHELKPGRGVEEEILHHQGGARRDSRRDHRR